MTCDFTASYLGHRPSIKHTNMVYFARFQLGLNLDINMQDIDIAKGNDVEDIDRVSRAWPESHVSLEGEKTMNQEGHVSLSVWLRLACLNPRRH